MATLYFLCRGNSIQQPNRRSPKDTPSYWVKRAEYKSWKEASPGGGTLRSKESSRDCLETQGSGVKQEPDFWYMRWSVSVGSNLVSSLNRPQVSFWTGRSRNRSLEQRNIQDRRASLATGGITYNKKLFINPQTRIRRPTIKTLMQVQWLTLRSCFWVNKAFI